MKSLWYQRHALSHYTFPEGAFAGNDCSHGRERRLSREGICLEFSTLSDRRCVVFMTEPFPSLTQKNPEDI